MKRSLVLGTVSLLLALAAALPVTARESVPFEAEFGQATITGQSCDGPVCETVFEGTGSVNIMGRVVATATIIQDFSILPCNPASGELTFRGETGTINLTETSVVCLGTNPVGALAFISGQWEVTGGTGEFDGITGNGTDFGPITPGQGPVVHFDGSVSY